MYHKYERDEQGKMLGMWQPDLGHPDKGERHWYKPESPSGARSARKKALQEEREAESGTRVNPEDRLTFTEYKG